MGRISPRSLRDKIALMDSQAIGTNAYGDITYGLVNIGEWPASVSIISTTEDEIGRDTFTKHYKFVVEPNCPVEGVDSVLWKGKTYAVEGDPEDHLVSGGILHHKEFIGKVHIG